MVAAVLVRVAYLAVSRIAEVLRESGRAAEARAHSAEAVRLCRALVAEAPGVLEEDLKLALVVHDGVLADLGESAPAG